jgi:hypothetical protein
MNEIFLKGTKPISHNNMRIYESLINFLYTVANFLKSNLVISAI